MSQAVTTPAELVELGKQFAEVFNHDNYPHIDVDGLAARTKLAPLKALLASACPFGRELPGDPPKPKASKDGIVTQLRARYTESVRMGELPFATTFVTCAKAACADQHSNTKRKAPAADDSTTFPLVAEAEALKEAPNVCNAPSMPPNTTSSRLQPPVRSSPHVASASASASSKRFKTMNSAPPMPDNFMPLPDVPNNPSVQHQEATAHGTGNEAIHARYCDYVSDVFECIERDAELNAKVGAGAYTSGGYTNGDVCPQSGNSLPSFPLGRAGLREIRMHAPQTGA
jgi:hypothetical protein